MQVALVEVDAYTAEELYAFRLLKLDKAPTPLCIESTCCTYSFVRSNKFAQSACEYGLTELGKRILQQTDAKCDAKCVLCWACKLDRMLNICVYILWIGGFPITHW